jgi:MoxR-like ATPase
MDCVNAALYIVIQCGLPGIAWGGTGECKTAFLEALIRAIGLKPFVFIPSQHMPEDIGGIPDIDKKAGLVRMVYPEWLVRMTKAGYGIIFDEMTTAPQPMRPALLSLLNEGRTGDLCLHPSTIRVAAANPPELAPNSSPLEASMLNRLYHHDWELPFDTWMEGMMNGGKFTVPTNFPIVGDTTSYLPKWTRRVAYLLQRQPALRSCRRIPEDDKAFPSLRQWYNLSRCLAGADKVKAGGDVVNQIATGIIGSAGAGQLMQSIAAKDLYNPAEVVDGTTKIDYSSRVDQLIFLPVGIMETLADDHASKRLDNGVEVLIEMGENGLLDCVGPVLNDLTNTYKDYRVPKKLLARYGKLVAQIGGAA